MLTVRAPDGRPALFSVVKKALWITERVDASRPRRALEQINPLRRAAGSVQPGEVGLHPFVLPERKQRLAKNTCCARTGRHRDFIVHPFTVAPGDNNARAPQIREMARNLGLALVQNLDEIADTHLSSVHQVQEPEPGAVRERGKQQRQVVAFRGTVHISIIYALTDMSSG